MNRGTTIETRLTLSHTLKLHAWFLAHKELIEKNNRTVIAEIASKELGFKVSPSSIGKLEPETGIKSSIAKARDEAISGAKAVPAGNRLSSLARIMLHVLDNLKARLGEDFITQEDRNKLERFSR